MFPSGRFGGGAICRSRAGQKRWVAEDRFGAKDKEERYAPARVRLVQYLRPSDCYEPG